MIFMGGLMGRKIRHHRSRRQAKRFFGRYSATELAMAVLGGAILVLVVVLVASALLG